MITNLRLRLTTRAFAATAIAALAVAVAPVINQPAYASTAPHAVVAKATVTTKVVKVSAGKYGTKSYRPVGKLTAGGRAIKGKRITLQRKSSGRWAGVKSCTTNRYGKCAVVTTPTASRYYRWKFAGDSRRKADVSASFYLKKRSASSGLDYTYRNGSKVYNATSANDLDCGQIPSYKKPVRVHGSDPWRLDRDKDGYGCD